MVVQAQKLTPPNWIWKIRAAQSKGKGTWILLGLLAVLASALLIQYPNWRPVAAVSATLACIDVAFYMLFASFEHSRGCWRRYSVVQAQRQYFTLVMPLVFFATGLREKGEHAAEFEIAVLESRGRAFGAVLFHVEIKDSMGNAQEKALMIVDPQGRAVTFGEAYHLNFAT